MSDKKESAAAIAEPKTAEMVKIQIDDYEVEVPKGTTILEAARKVGVDIPTLCYHQDLDPIGSCRICVVDVEDQRTLIAACAYPVDAPMTIRTYTPRVRQSRRHTLELLLANHFGQCLYCSRNENCELQDLAGKYGIDVANYPTPDKPRFEIDDSSPVIRDNNKCIRCFRCLRTCRDMQDVCGLAAAGRGDDLKVTTFMDSDLGDVLCVHCGQCVNRCPTGALTEKDMSDDVWAAIDDPTKHVVIQTAPAPRAAIGECFGLEAGTLMTGQLNTALKRMGIDRVFDTNFTADLTILEEGTELLLRLKKALVDKEKVTLPQITSCSPGWIKYIEYYYPQFLDHLSTCKSPQQMFGTLIKTWYAEMHKIDPVNIVTVSLMPCTAKKFECSRPEMRDSGYKDVDYVLTTREMAKMIKEAGMNLANLPETGFDDPMGVGSGAGQIFGATGGVMEAAIRTAYEIVTGEEVPFEHLDIKPLRGMEGLRSAELPIPKAVDDWKFLEGATLKVLVSNGLSNARKVMEMLADGELYDYHFVEIMACPGGCLGGGGQPIPTSAEIRQARANAIYEADADLPIRKSHENPIVARIYKEFLPDGPCGHKSHELLHTSYVARGREVV
jgi:NADP-reducing hydrogenase subunit HndD